jgi:V8-like Glu-specific endopeptidase
MSLGIMEQLTHSTVRIETTSNSGSWSCGTGFYMNFLEKDNSCFPVIITNKHVVSGAEVGKFHVTFSKNDGTPDIGNHKLFEIENFEQTCIKHPDPNVDLVAFPIGQLVNKIRNSGENLFYTPLQTNLIPQTSESESFSVMEDIVMIGYPSGIWDSKNNLPIIRRGITATHSSIDYNGKTEFLTDIASFPGSSGSPVFLANLNGYTDNKGSIFMGTPRIRLLGVHYAGFNHDAQGEIKIITAPTSNVPFSITQIPNNIGVVINSKRILEIERLIGQQQ